MFSVAAISANAQFQVNPQLGVTFQNLTSTDQGLKYKSALGYQLGADLRIGGRLFFQPGAFIGRNATVITSTTTNGSETATIEDNLIRTNLKLKALVGYRLIDSYQFDLRLVAGPTYDVLLSSDLRDHRIAWNSGDFNNGSFNVDAGLGFDMGVVTVEPSASFGLSRAFSDNPSVSNISSKYITYGLTIGVNFGDDDK